jgi:predicted secreted Zn-dependent protease
MSQIAGRRSWSIQNDGASGPAVFDETDERGAGVGGTASIAVSSVDNEVRWDEQIP